jgi:hypothetical protein
VSPTVYGWMSRREKAKSESTVPLSIA